MSAPPLVVHCDARVSAAGTARFGWVISDGQAIVAYGVEEPPGTFWRSNDAEMYAVVAGAQALAEELRARPLEGLSGVAIVSDSRSIIDHITGRVLVSGGELDAPTALLRAVCRRLPPCLFVWVPRDLNRAADWLTRDPDPRRPMPEVPPPLPEKALRQSRAAIPIRSTRTRTPSPKDRRPLSPAHCGWRISRAGGMATVGEVAAERLHRLAKQLDYERERKAIEEAWDAPS